MTTSLEQSPEGQATYGMANLRPDRTGLSSIVFVSQRENAHHAARVKVSPAPKVRADAMGSYALSPFAHTAGWRWAAADETALARRVALNETVLQRYWYGEIAYTENALAQLQPLR